MNKTDFSQELEAMPRLFSGMLCLDFANSIEPRGGPTPFAPPPENAGRHEYLDRYRDLVVWGIHTEVIDVEQGAALLELAEQQQDEARDVFERSINLREVIYRVFYALATNHQPDSADLELLSAEHRSAMQHRSLGQSGDGFSWAWDTDLHLERVIWPVVISATSLLVEGERARIKVCPGVPGQPIPCAWLFYDASKNRARTWCSMSDCGGLVKARRQNARRRK